MYDNSNNIYYMSVQINHNYCLAFRNANSQNQQCNKHPVENSSLCSRHLKSHIIATEDRLIYNIDDTNIYSIINNNNFQSVKLYKFSKDELKHNCSLLNLSTNGTKKTLYNRIFDHFSQIKKQQVNITHENYTVNDCINNTDPITLEPLKNYNEIYYVKDKSTIYGFSYKSIFNIITLGDKRNPYTRKQFSEKTINTVTQIYKLDENDTEYNVDIESLTPLQRIQHVFYFADYDAGYYTDYKWFTQLKRSQYINLYFEMMDLWNYRMQWSNSLKNDICKNPIFLIKNLNNLSIEKLKILLIKTICNLCFSSKNKDSKILGITLFLTALTMVSFEAACSLPMLVQESSLIPNLIANSPNNLI